LHTYSAQCHYKTKANEHSYIRMYVESVSITLYISSPLPSPAVAVCHKQCAHTLTAHVSVHIHMQHKCIAIVALLCSMCTYYYYASTVHCYSSFTVQHVHLLLLCTVLQCIHVCTHGQATAEEGKGLVTRHRVAHCRVHEQPFLQQMHSSTAWPSTRTYARCEPESCR
jgi:hypothetical protein